MDSRYYKSFGRDGHWARPCQWICAFCLLSSMLFSCTAGGYDSGDGPYSYYSADLAMVHTMDRQIADYMLTDEKDSVHFSPLARLDYAERADSFYRSLVYYNKVSSKPVRLLPSSRFLYCFLLWKMILSARILCRLRLVGSAATTGGLIFVFP